MSEPEGHKASCRIHFKLSQGSQYCNCGYESSPTVEVKVTLPKLPEGWEYTGEWRTILKDEWYMSVFGHPVQSVDGKSGYGLILRRVAPPEHKLAVMLSEGDVRELADLNQRMSNGWCERLFDAARAALAQQEVCGGMVCKFSRGGLHVPENCDALTTPCQQPKGHAGAHTPEKQA